MAKENKDGESENRTQINNGLGSNDFLIGSAARMQQKEKELQKTFCNSLILLVSRTGIEPVTY